MCLCNNSLLQSASWRLSFPRCTTGREATRLTHASELPTWTTRLPGIIPLY